MVASMEVDIPSYGCVGRQRGRGICAVVQVIGKAMIPFSSNYFVPAAKRVGVVLIKFAAPEIVQVLRDKKIIKMRKRIWKNRLSENSRVLVAGRG